MQIADRIASDNPAAAERFDAGFRRTCRQLVEFPYIGTPRRFRGRAYRGLRSRSIKGFESWLVFYAASRSTVEIVRVLHGARDLRRALRS